MSAILGFFSSYLRMAAVAGFVALAAIIGLLYWQWSLAEKRADDLRIANDRLNGQVVVLQQAAEDRDAAIRELEQTNKTLAKQAADLNDILQELRNAPDSDDGSISPLLLRLLERLDRLRNGPAANPR